MNTRMMMVVALSREVRKWDISSRRGAEARRSF